MSSAIRCLLVLAIALATVHAQDRATATGNTPAAKSAVFFVGDGMGVSTVTAARVFSVGVGGQLVMDQAPHVALSRTYTSDFITPDSAGTMTAMISGSKTNSGIIGLGPKTERGDFNKDGDGQQLPTILELARAQGKSIGLVSTARITHATPAACYAKVNERDAEDAIALQLLPGSPTYNAALGDGVDVIFGGGRRHFLGRTERDGEGDRGRRRDGQNLIKAFEAKGYTYVWNSEGFEQLGEGTTKVLGLFDSSHMEWEFDRKNDVGKEPSLQQMTEKAIEILSRNPKGFFLMVESGRIDHAHHAGNAWRALVDTEEFDQAIGATLKKVNLAETLVLATADHSHVFNIQGYPLRPLNELPYAPLRVPEGFQASDPTNGLFGPTWQLSRAGEVILATDANGVPYTPLIYGNGPGYRGISRVDPARDSFRGVTGDAVQGSADPNYRQEAAMPLGSETHGGEDVAIYGFGAGANLVRGTRENTYIFSILKTAMGL